VNKFVAVLTTCFFAEVEGAEEGLVEEELAIEVECEEVEEVKIKETCFRQLQLFYAGEPC